MGMLAYIYTLLSHFHMLPSYPPQKLWSSFHPKCSMGTEVHPLMLTPKGEKPQRRTWQRSTKAWATEAEDLVMEFSLLFLCWGWRVWVCGALGMVHISGTHCGPWAPSSSIYWEWTASSQAPPKTYGEKGGRWSLVVCILTSTRVSTAHTRVYTSGSQNVWWNLLKIFLRYTQKSTKIRISV